MPRRGQLQLIPPEKAPGGINYYCRGTHRGVPVNQSLRTDLKPLAERELKKIRDRIDREALMPEPPSTGNAHVTFEHVAIMYLMKRQDMPTDQELQTYKEAVRLDPTKHGRSKSTRHLVEKLTKHFRGTPRSAFNATLIAVEERRFFRDAQLSVATINRHYRVPLSAILNHLAEPDGLLHRIRVAKLSNKREQPELRRVSAKDARALIKAAREVEKLNFRTKAGRTNGRFFALMVTLLKTGLRIGSLVKLRKGDVDLQRKRLVLEKTKPGHDVAVPIDAEVVAAIKTCITPEMPDDAKVFRYSTRWSVQSSLRKACKIANVKFSPHDSRRALATNLNEADVSLPTIKAAGGWKSTPAVMRYITVSDKAMRRALAVMPKLGETGKRKRRD